MAGDAVAALVEVPFDRGVVPRERLDLPERDEAARLPLRHPTARAPQPRGKGRDQGLKILVNHAAGPALRLHVPLPDQLGVACYVGDGGQMHSPQTKEALVGALLRK